MNELFFILYAVAFGFLNMGAGRDFWGLTTSTQLNRILFAAGGSLLATFFAMGNIWLFVGLVVGLYLWRLPAWDFAAINGKTKPQLWQNKIAVKIYKNIPTDVPGLRLFGTLGMAIRHSLIVPAVAFFAFMTGDWTALVAALAFPLMGGAYYIGGFPREHSYSVAVAEFMCGVIIAAMLWSY